MKNISNWQPIKLKYLADLRSGETITSELIEKEEEYPVYGGGALRGYTNNYTHDGEYILIGRQGANCGSVRKVAGKFYASEHAIVVTYNKKVDYQWFYYLLDSMNLNQYSIAAAQPGLSVSTIKNLTVKLPSINEQIKIRNYINYKLAVFTETIVLKEKLIALLEEKRQSIISEIVTKGLNPNAKMKDSGVEWIGEIPEHWEVKPLYTIFKENKIKNKGNRYSNVLSLSYGKIKRRDVESNHGLLPDSFETYQILEDGDIVLRLTDLQNDKRSLRVGLVEEKGIITSAYVGLKGTQNMNSKYAYYLLHFYDVVKVFYGLGSGVRQSMGYAELKKMSLIIPPLEEQKQIVEYISIKVIENEQVVDVLKMQIQKLKEYRQSLIYEAVTGKIDVRELVTEK